MSALDVSSLPSHRAAAPEHEVAPTRRLVIAGRLRGAPTVKPVTTDDPCALYPPDPGLTWRVGADGLVHFSDGSWCSDPTWRPRG